jgi:hypothetical protein
VFQAVGFKCLLQASNMNDTDQDLINLRRLEYAGSHPCCNLIKNDSTIISLDPAADPPVSVDTTAIKILLADIMAQANNPSNGQGCPQTPHLKNLDINNCLKTMKERFLDEFVARLNHSLRNTTTTFASAGVILFYYRYNQLMSFQPSIEQTIHNILSVSEAIKNIVDKIKYVLYETLKTELKRNTFLFTSKGFTNSGTPVSFSSFWVDFATKDEDIKNAKFLLSCLGRGSAIDSWHDVITRNEISKVRLLENLVPTTLAISTYMKELETHVVGDDEFKTVTTVSFSSKYNLFIDAILNLYYSLHKGKAESQNSNICVIESIYLDNVIMHYIGLDLFYTVIYLMKLNRPRFNSGQDLYMYAGKLDLANTDATIANLDGQRLNMNSSYSTVFCEFIAIYYTCRLHWICLIEPEIIIPSSSTPTDYNELLTRIEAYGFVFFKLFQILPSVIKTEYAIDVGNLKVAGHNEITEDVYTGNLKNIKYPKAAPTNTLTEIIFTLLNTGTVDPQTGEPLRDVICTSLWLRKMYDDGFGFSDKERTLLEKSPCFDHIMAGGSTKMKGDHIMAGGSTKMKGGLGLSQNDVTQLQMKAQTDIAYMSDEQTLQFVSLELQQQANTFIQYISQLPDNQVIRENYMFYVVGYAKNRAENITRNRAQQDIFGMNYAQTIQFLGSNREEQLAIANPALERLPLVLRDIYMNFVSEFVIKHLENIEKYTYEKAEEDVAGMTDQDIIGFFHGTDEQKDALLMALIAPIDVSMREKYKDYSSAFLMDRADHIVYEEAKTDIDAMSEEAILQFLHFNREQQQTASAAKLAQIPEVLRNNYIGYIFALGIDSVEEFIYKKAEEDVAAMTDQDTIRFFSATPEAQREAFAAMSTMIFNPALRNNYMGFIYEFAKKRAENIISEHAKQIVQSKSPGEILTLISLNPKQQRDACISLLSQFPPELHDSYMGYIVTFARNLSEIFIKSTNLINIVEICVNQLNIDEIARFCQSSPEIQHGIISTISGIDVSIRDNPIFMNYFVNFANTIYNNNKNRYRTMADAAVKIMSDDQIIQFFASEPEQQRGIIVTILDDRELRVELSMFDNFMIDFVNFAQERLTPQIKTMVDTNDNARKSALVPQITKNNNDNFQKFNVRIPQIRRLIEKNDAKRQRYNLGIENHGHNGLFFIVFNNGRESQYRMKKYNPVVNNGLWPTLIDSEAYIRHGLPKMLYSKTKAMYSTNPDAECNNPNFLVANPDIYQLLISYSLLYFTNNSNGNIFNSRGVKIASYPTGGHLGGSIQKYKKINRTKQIRKPINNQTRNKKLNILKIRDKLNKTKHKHNQTRFKLKYKINQTRHKKPKRTRYNKNIKKRT